MRYRTLLIYGLALILVACSSFPTGTPTPARATPIPTPVDPGILASEGDAALLRTRIPALVSRDQAFAALLTQAIPVLTLSAGLSADQQKAQDLALRSPQFLQYTRDPNSGAALRSEIFGIYPLRESDLTPRTEPCRSNSCLRVEMYNYAINLTSVAIVNISQGALVLIDQQPDTQPDIPDHLTTLATLIAANAPEVATELGTSPSPGQALMPNVKTSLHESQCERSKHLCVAPTFLVGERALWAIVDLTAGTLVGARWTDLGAYQGQRLTEKQLQNDIISRHYCEVETPLTHAGWSMRYILTSSDGLRISEVAFQGKPILRNAKLVDWHVSYSQRQGFGYSDAVGCPIFSQSAVIAIGPPVVHDLSEHGQVVGFTLSQSYWSEFWPQPCNYNYQQTYEFYSDGRFRVKAASLGRGCGNDGTYRPVFRIAFANPGTVATWDGSIWNNWQQEQWALQSKLKSTTEGYQLRIANQNGGGWYLEPSNGQFSDGGRGDNAYIYATKYDPQRDEGEADMITIGPCCNQDEHQGPEKFIEPNPEPLEDSQLILWYVPQLKNDDTPGKQYCWADSVLENGVYQTQTYPCFAGPLFVPYQ